MKKLTDEYECWKAGKARRFRIFFGRVRTAVGELLGDLPSDITEDDIEEHLGHVWLDQYVKEILAETKAIADKEPYAAGDGPEIVEDER